MLKTILLTAVAAASLIACRAEAQMAFEERPVSIRNDRWTCEHQPSVAWCAASAGVEAAGVAPTRLQVVKAERAVRKTWVNKKDMPDDNWRSYVEQVEKGEEWVDDCTGLAPTVLDLLARQGVARDKMYRALVATRAGGEADHMIGLIEIDGRLWVVGDALAVKDEPYEFADSKSRYRYVYVSRVSGGTKWFKVAKR